MITRRNLHWLGTLAILGLAIVLPGSSLFTRHELPLLLRGANQSYASPALSPGKLPLGFELNRGQTDRQVDYVARARNGTIFLRPDEAVLSLKNSGTGSAGSRVSAGRLAGAASNDGAGGVVRMRLVAANPHATSAGIDALPGRSNYLFGRDSRKWIVGVPQYRKIAYRGVYPGVDVAYYGNEGQLEQDFIVAPGARPDAISIELASIARGHTTGALAVDRDGNLQLRTNGGMVEMRKPFVYQEVSGSRQPIAARYVLQGADRVGFEVARYDGGRPLVIDPVLSYSTYLGGSGDDVANAVAVDASGAAYMTGVTTSLNYPLANAFEGPVGGKDVFVSKVAADGSALLYSTYIGGSADDSGNAIAVGSNGSATIVGTTASLTDFPGTNGQGKGSTEAFAARLSATGSSLVYATFLGGNGANVGSGVAVDTAGNAYVTGSTDALDFPTTTGAYQNVNNGGRDSFVTKLNSTGTGMVYSTYVGGSQNDAASGIALASSGDAFITGDTSSSDFPSINGLPDTTGPAFAAELNASGSALVYSTYIDNTSHAAAISVDGAGQIYVAGDTSSTQFVTTTGVAQPNPGGASDVFLIRLDPSQTGVAQRHYATYLGGSGDDHATGIAVDAYQNVYITGSTLSTDFPIQRPVQVHNGGQTDAFVVKLSATAGSLVYSTYLGGSNDDIANGIALDPSGNAIVVGYTSSTNFPLMNPLQGANANGEDAFITKIVDVPQPPNSLLARGISASEIDLNWSDNQTNQTSFKVSREPGMGPGPFTQIASVPGNSSSYNNTTVPGLGTYSYQVAAANSAGTSGPGHRASACSEPHGNSHHSELRVPLLGGYERRFHRVHRTATGRQRGIHSPRTAPCRPDNLPGQRTDIRLDLHVRGGRCQHRRRL